MILFSLFGKNADKNSRNLNDTASDEVPPALPFSKKALVVLDGSQAGFKALDYAISLGLHIPSCEINAAFVIDTASMDLLLQMHIFVSEERTSFEEELEMKGRRTLEFARNKGQKYGLKIDTFLMKGRVSQTILQATRELSADLLIIGGWHDGSTRKDTSSVEYQFILDQANCPVIVIKADD